VAPGQQNAAVPTSSRLICSPVPDYPRPTVRKPLSCGAQTIRNGTPGGPPGSKRRGARIRVARKEVFQRWHSTHSVLAEIHPGELRSHS